MPRPRLALSCLTLFCPLGAAVRSERDGDAPVLEEAAAHGSGGGACDVLCRRALPEQTMRINQARFFLLAEDAWKDLALNLTPTVSKSPFVTISLSTPDLLIQKFGRIWKSYCFLGLFVGTLSKNTPPPKLVKISPTWALSAQQGLR